MHAPLIRDMHSENRLMALSLLHMYIKKKMEWLHNLKSTKQTAVKTLESFTQSFTHTLTLRTWTPLRVNLPENRVLKVGLVECYTSAEAAWGQLTVCGRELGGEDHVTVRVDWADLTQQCRTLRNTLLKLRTALIEGQQTHAITIRRTDETTVRAEAQLLDVATAYIGLLDVVREPQRAARWDRQPRWSSLLKLVHTRPLQREKQSNHTVGKSVCSALDSYTRSRSGVFQLPRSHYIERHGWMVTTVNV